MRKPTRRKFYARSAIASELRIAATELQKAIELAGKPPEESPLSLNLSEVVKVLNRAIENERIYQLGRKRIQAALVREKKAIEQLLAEVKGVPITQDEKLLAKRKVKSAGK